MFRKVLLSCAISTALATGCAPLFAGNTNNGAFAFTPIDGSANSTAWNPAAPWKIPAGFSQSVVASENSLNIYAGGRNDWHDMNTVNETGRKAGR